jgi:hypothetical protein
LRAKNSQKSEIRVEKMEEMIILLRKRQLIDYHSPIRHRNSPKRKRRRLLEGKNSQKKRN